MNPPTKEFSNSGMTNRGFLQLLLEIRNREIHHSGLPRWIERLPPIVDWLGHQNLSFSVDWQWEPQPWNLSANQALSWLMFRLPLLNICQKHVYYYVLLYVRGTLCTYNIYIICEQIDPCSGYLFSCGSLCADSRSCQTMQQRSALFWPRSGSWAKMASRASMYICSTYVTTVLLRSL